MSSFQAVTFRRLSLQVSHKDLLHFAASNVSQSSDNRTDKSNGANIQQKKSEAARKVLPDMTEFMKVQVNFTLDEVRKIVIGP